MGILSRIMGKSESTLTELVKPSKELGSPLMGEVIPLETVNDEAFAKKSMGDGLAIIPAEGKLYAPMSGMVEALFFTNHAIAIAGDNGINVILHIGIDTVEMGGDGFEALVQQGDRVEKGQFLITFDMDKIKSSGYEATTMVLLPDSSELGILHKRDIGQVMPQEKLLWLG